MQTRTPRNRAWPQSAERSFAARKTFADEYIEHWACVYLANPYLGRAGVAFETFLFAPVEILATCALPSVDLDRAGLLPAQRGARTRAELAAALQYMNERAIVRLAAECHCANGTWVEKLRHHAWGARRRAPRKLKEM